MRVIVDGIIYSLPQGGIAHYFDEILPRISKLPETKIELMMPRSAARSAPLSDAIAVKKSALPKGNIIPWTNLRKKLSPLRKKVDEARWLLKTMNPGDTVFHSTYFTEFPNKRVPHVVTVHDMTHELFPNFFSNADDEIFRQRKASCIKNAASLIAVSENTKKDLCEVYGIEPSKVKVIYHSVNPEIFFDDSTNTNAKVMLAKNHGVDKPFVLFVGQRWGYKNFPTFLEAFAQSDVRKSHLLVAAGEEWTAVEKDTLKKLGIEDSTRLVHFPDKNMLRTLYSFASLFIYPSLAEGFGMPLLEAMACGTPVAAAAASCFPEIVQDSALLFDPTNPKDIADAMDKLAQPKYASLYRSRGFDRIRCFSWDVAAARTWEVYRRTLGYPIVVDSASLAS